MGNNLEKNDISPNENNEYSVPNNIKYTKEKKSINEYNPNSKNSSTLSNKRKRSDDPNDEDNIEYKIRKIKDYIDEITDSKIIKEKVKIKEENEKLKIKMEKNENKFKIIEKFEQIKKQLKSFLKSSLYINTEIKDITSDNNNKDILIKNIKEIMNDYWIKNKKELKPLYQSLNSEYKKTVLKEIGNLENEVLSDYIKTSKTIILPNKKNIQNTKNNNHYIIDKNKTINKDEAKVKEKQQIDNNIVEKTSLNYIDNKNNEISNNNLNINTESLIEENEFNNYSYKCLTNNLNFIISKGTKQLIFTMELENNGKLPWPENKTILSTDLSISNIKIKEIVLEPLKPGLKSSINGIFTDTDKLEPGKYESYLIFKVDGKKYGNNILINIEVLKNDIKKEYKTVIGAFRNDYDITKDIASDTIIGEELYRNQTFEGTCDSLLKSLDK